MSKNSIQKRHSFSQNMFVLLHPKRLNKSKTKSNESIHERCIHTSVCISKQECLLCRIQDSCELISDKCLQKQDVTLTHQAQMHYPSWDEFEKNLQKISDKCSCNTSHDSAHMKQYHSSL